ncbi:MAG: hypothetical protein OEU68_16835 [Nitrospira sp.]|nr:hypothetical protein [Nitrospira sp.]MDH4246003.1 hypothetical protein [Nitrospira sp.]MDH4356955.1 hypothetical protein [Nitrospira sp.]MDH5318924.1 hypothetical protein [Nitrospira sp.]
MSLPVDVLSVGSVTDRRLIPSPANNPLTAWKSWLFLAKRLIE